MSFIFAPAEELIHLSYIAANGDEIEKIRLTSGDRLIRSAVGESLVFTNNVQVMIRPGYFSLSSANGVSIEKRKDGLTVIVFANGDQLSFNDEGIKSLLKGRLLFKFKHAEKGECLSDAKSA